MSQNTWVGQWIMLKRAQNEYDTMRSDQCILTFVKDNQPH